MSQVPTLSLQFKGGGVQLVGPGVGVDMLFVEMGGGGNGEGGGGRRDGGWHFVVSNVFSILRDIPLSQVTSLSECDEIPRFTEPSFLAFCTAVHWDVGWSSLSKTSSFGFCPLASMQPQLIL